MGSYQAFELEELQADRSRSYAEFLRRPGVSMGIYHLPAGGKDPQHPHAADEVSPRTIPRPEPDAQDGRQRPARDRPRRISGRRAPATAPAAPATTALRGPDR